MTVHLVRFYVQIIMTIGGKSTPNRFDGREPFSQLVPARDVAKTLSDRHRCQVNVCKNLEDDPGEWTPIATFVNGVEVVLT